MNTKFFGSVVEIYSELILNCFLLKVMGGNLIFFPLYLQGVLSCLEGGANIFFISMNSNLLNCEFAISFLLIAELLVFPPFDNGILQGALRDLSKRNQEHSLPPVEQVAFISYLLIRMVICASF